MREIEITKKEEGQRLDKMLQKYLNKAGKSFLYKMLRKKNIKLNGKKAAGNEKLKAGDCIALYLAEETIEKFREEVKVQEQKIPLDVLYEDENVLLINKPYGILSQKAGREDLSINEQIAPYALERGLMSAEDLNRIKPSVCNRLDRNTTGILIAGISLEGLQTMSELLKKREIDKYYFCIVKGEIKKKEKVSGYLIKDEKHNKVTVSRQKKEKGAYIETWYEPISCKNGFTFLKVKLVTGKTHQIRAHLAGQGHPLAGDFKYGDEKINRKLRSEFGIRGQLLHCGEVRFPENMERCVSLQGRKIQAPLPGKFERVRSELMGDAVWEAGI